MVEIIKTDAFEEAFRAIRDSAAQQKILVRIRRLSLGNPGSVRPVGEGISELKIDHGPGYRVYYAQRGAELALILLCGDKSTQDRDIAKAKELNLTE